MKTLIIGSTAMKKWFPESWSREPKDYDTFSNWPFTEGMDALWHPSFDSWVPRGTTLATPDQLYTIKVSHLGWDLKNNSWNKHADDAMWLKRQGARIDETLFKSLYAVWEELHGEKRVNLTMESGDFFNDAVARKYDHDSLHESVAYGDHAMYLDVLRDDSGSVSCDMKKIKALSFEDKVKLFREEVFATALERKVIPSNYRVSPRAAYAWALRRTVTSLTKGWSSRFLIENYDVMRQLDSDDNYVQRHRDNSERLILL